MLPNGPESGLDDGEEAVLIDVNDVEPGGGKKERLVSEGSRMGSRLQLTRRSRRS